MLELERVSKTYRVGTFGGKALRAVDEVSFSVDRGEVVALIGESGSGKTTIGKMVLRLIPVTSGRILYNGDDVATFKGAALKDYHRRVQGVFQDPFSSYNPIFKADRVFRIVHQEFFPTLGAKEWKEKLDRSLSAVGLAPREVLNKYAHQLSGGQLQRLLIARALLLEIEFLVADEVISMLDASTRVDVLNLLAGLREERALSTLFITHDLSLGYYISDQAVILYRGTVVERGGIEDLYARPIHPYTQMLMASVPRLDRKWEEAPLGLKSQQVGLGTGCVYYERCPFPYRDERCRTEKPLLVERERGHFVACHPRSEAPSPDGRPALLDR
ncbi:MAG TPA: ABC transporter ATP-binding protein [Candidatus Bipolaricaulis sp.]|nr:ABC transporter ATP-binding protein [Candidatus Bipolaricaulis sp.]HRS14338.1 ABC transporter ATP-binding protein [Candidatus Bipolaricaulis sp.]HRU21156.1 ABC transporter ATP-binding protein [Candidatus Bipolaricaulis sp.]